MRFPDLSHPMFETFDAADDVPAAGTAQLEHPHVVPVPPAIVSCQASTCCRVQSFIKRACPMSGLSTAPLPPPPPPPLPPTTSTATTSATAHHLNRYRPPPPSLPPTTAHRPRHRHHRPPPPALNSAAPAASLSMHRHGVLISLQSWVKIAEGCSPGQDKVRAPALYFLAHLANIAQHA